MRLLLLTLGVLALLTLPACAGSAPAPQKAVKAQRQPPKHAAQLYLSDSPQALDLDQVRFVGMDDGPVPEFSLTAMDGRKFESARLVGERAFLVVFFATWCEVCNVKMPMLRDALERLGELTVIGVAVDEDDTWPAVPPYLERHGLKFPIVRATHNPKFAVSYNPFSAVPLVVVVGKNGGLVDLQMGYSPNDGQRLVAAVKLARRIPPLREWVPAGN